MREKILLIFYDFTTIMFETKYEATKVEGIKILTPKQLLDRFSTALEQVKAGNALDNLLSEIRQIFYSLHQAKKNI